MVPAEIQLFWETGATAAASSKAQNIDFYEPALQ